MNDTMVTVVGNVVDDPQHRSAEGVPVTHFRVASTARRYDRNSGTWVNRDSLFLRVTCWRGLAEHVVASLKSGQPVVVTGRLTTKTWEQDGARRSQQELEATAIGHDLTWGTALFEKADRRRMADASAAGHLRDSGGSPPQAGAESQLESDPALAGAGTS